MTAPLVKYLLLPCYTNRPEDFDVEGAIVELSADFIQWMLDVAKFIEPLDDQFKQFGNNTPLNRLVFAGEVEWLMSALEADLASFIIDSSGPLDLTKPLMSNFEDLFIIEGQHPRGGRGRWVIDSEEAKIIPGDELVGKVESWLQLIRTEHLDNSDFDNFRLNIDREAVWWSALHPFGDASTVMVETYSIELPVLEELLKELKAGQGLPPGLREQQHQQQHLKDLEEEMAHGLAQQSED